MVRVGSKAVVTTSTTTLGTKNRNPGRIHRLAAISLPEPTGPYLGSIGTKRDLLLRTFLLIEPENRRYFSTLQRPLTASLSSLARSDTCAQVEA